MIRVKTKKGKTKKGYYVKTFNPDKHELCPPKRTGIHITGSTSTIPDILTLTCKKCGRKQTYTTKYAYRRAMGIGSDQTQTHKGLCGKCSMSQKRKPHGPRSKEQLKHMRLVQIKKMGYNTIEEYEKDSMSKKKYYERVDQISRTNLKREKPELYKLWNENKWNGTDMNQLTIEHIKPKSICYELGIPIEEASDISNLDIISMKENNESWKVEEYNLKVKNKIYGKETVKKRLLAGDTELWNRKYKKGLDV